MSRSGQSCSSEKIERDSGFVSCTSGFLDSCSSMRVAQPSQDTDHIKDLQVDFAGINNLDAPLNIKSESSSSVVVPLKHDDSLVRQDQQQQLKVQQHAPIFKQPLQYFQQDDDGDTQLHISIYDEFTDVALWLINCAPHSSLLDIKNDDCLTALHIATMTRQSQIIRRLILVGADSTITTTRLYQPWTSSGNAAIHMACEADDCESLKALTEPLTQQEHLWLASNNRLPPVLGQDLELRNYDGVSPIHTAIKRGNLTIVKQLVKVGAKVNTMDPRSGFSSFHLAITSRRREVVEYMAKEHNTCLNIPTRFGTSSYEICLNVDQQLAEQLVRWGAEPKVRESDSETYSESDSEDSIDGESVGYAISSYSEIMSPISMIST